MFINRTEAGRMLAEALASYKDVEDGVVVGLPRGGVPVAHPVAQSLNLPLDLTCPKKIGAPFNPEFAIGAITETGEGIFEGDAAERLGVPDSYIQETIEEKKEEAQRKLAAYRQGLPERSFKDKVVILVDDGLATGSTMKAAVVSVRKEGAKTIVVAVPVSPPDTAEQIRGMVDDFVCLQTPYMFQAVGQFYENFSQTTDDEVLAIMQKYANAR